MKLTVLLLAAALGPLAFAPDAMAAPKKKTPPKSAPRADLTGVSIEELQKAMASGPAWLTDFIKGDNSGGGFTTPAAVAGYPHITVPAGFVNSLPCGLSFVGSAWSEPRLFALAHAFEQATKHRRAPRFAKTVNAWKD